MEAARRIELDCDETSSNLMEGEVAELRRRVAHMDRDQLMADDVQRMLDWAMRTEWPHPIQNILPCRRAGL